MAPAPRARHAKKSPVSPAPVVLRLSYEASARVGAEGSVRALVLPRQAAPTPKPDKKRAETTPKRDAKQAEATPSKRISPFRKRLQGAQTRTEPPDLEQGARSDLAMADEEAEKAAVRVQASIRGRQARARLASAGASATPSAEEAKVVAEV